MSILTDVLAKHKAQVVAAEDVLVRDFPRIPTGIFALDFATGGGFPVGVTSSIFGPPGGGKNTTIYKTIKGAQNICWSCFEYLWDCKCGEQKKQKAVLVSLEHIDNYWAEVLGVNLEDLIIIEPESGEHAIDVIVACIQADDCGLVVLDSLAMMTSITEIESSATQMQVGLQARLLSKMIRVLKATMMREKKRKHRVSFIATNQLRCKIGSMFGPTEDVPGGYATKHDWHLMFRVSQLKSEKKNKSSDLVEEARFNVSMAAMGVKKKLRILAGSGEYYIVVGKNGELPQGTVNDLKTFLTFAEKVGIYSKAPRMLDGVAYSAGELRNKLYTDDHFFLSMKKKVIDEYIRRYYEEQYEPIIFENEKSDEG